MAALLVGGCSTKLLAHGKPPKPSPERPKAEARFLAGLDALHTGDDGILKELAAAKQDSLWRQRARTLLEWRQRASRHRDSGGLHRQLKACQAASAELARNNAALNRDLQALKQILIDMESRAK